MAPCSVKDINDLGFYIPYTPQDDDSVAESAAGGAGADDAKDRAVNAGSGGLRKDFMWGFATAAAQIEGGGKDKEEASGRGRSVRSPYCACRAYALADMRCPRTQCGVGIVSSAARNRR
jgi:hypothetical protein